jgi:hypothetical protein
MIGLRASPSGPDRCDEGLDAHDLDHPLHIVSQHTQTHLGSDVFECLGQKVGAAHPGFEGAEDMLDCSAPGPKRLDFPIFMKV